MERRVIAASVLACAWIVVGLAAPPTLAQSPPPPPQLTKIAPDRTSVGDLLTLTGANFQPPGGASQVTVHFGPIPIAVSPADDTSLSVTVPSGVQSGPVTVTTNALVNGLWVEQTSNSADILVIWADFHPSPTSPYGRYLTWADALLPGAADDLYAVTPHTDRWETAAIVHHISDQGQATTSDALYWPRSIGYGQSSLFWPVVSARNPADGQIYSLLVGTYNSPYYNPSHQTFEIRNVGTGSLALAAEIDQLTGTCPYTTFTISGFGFDGQGNLLVVGELYPCYHYDTAGHPVIDRPAAYDFWWFPASSLNGSTVALTPDTALLPSPVSMGDYLGGYFFDPFGLAVAPSGEAICRVYWTADFVNGVPQQVEQVAWAIPPLGSQEPIQQLPALPSIPADWQLNFRAVGTVTADCMGRFYAMGVNRSGSGPAGPIVEYERGPGGGWIQYQVTTAGGQGGTGCATSPLARADHLTADAYGNLYEVGHLPTGEYGAHHRFSPCELVDPNYYDDFNCCPTNVPLAGLVHKARGEQLQIECSTGTLKLKLTPEPGDPISGDPGDLNTFTWITPETDGRADASVLFGQAPKLEAVWQDRPGGGETSETVKWEVVPASETAPGADPKGLYPTKPELLFTGGANPYTNSALQFQTVHLGTFVLKATTTNTQHKGPNGQPAFIEVTVTVAQPDGLNDLGQAHHEYDGMIIYYADKYGIPPQYIKSQVFRESKGTYDPTVYRYELKSRDLDALAQWSEAQWQRDDYSMYRFPRAGAGTNFVDEDVAPREQYSYISGFNASVHPPAWPYTCARYQTADIHAFLWDIFEADDGWPDGSYPATVYPGHKGPCDRQNWLNKILTYLRHTDQFYCGTGSNVGPCSPGNLGAQSYMVWFSNNANYDAQTAVAASYGLLQVLYTTAVETMKWNEGQSGVGRHPSYLFNPGTSLDLGAGFDALNMRDIWKASFDSLLNYQIKLGTGFQGYNSKAKGYGPDIATKGYRFRAF